MKRRETHAGSLNLSTRTYPRLYNLILSPPHESPALEILGPRVFPCRLSRPRHVQHVQDSGREYLSILNILEAELRK